MEPITKHTTVWNNIYQMIDTANSYQEAGDLENARKYRGVAEQWAKLAENLLSEKKQKTGGF